MNKKSVIILAIVFLLILIGWFLYTDLNRNVCWPYCEGMTDQDREDIKKAALESEAKNWKIYKNEKYGFEVSYHTDWIYSESPISKDEKSGDIILSSTFLKSNISKEELRINVIDISRSSHQVLGLDSCYNTATGSDPETVSMNGNNFVKWNISKGLSTGGEGQDWGDGRRYCAIHRDVLYDLIPQIRYTPDPEGINYSVPNVDNSEVLNQILTSFKFTN